MSGWAALLAAVSVAAATQALVPPLLHVATRRRRPPRAETLLVWLRALPRLMPGPVRLATRRDTTAAIERAGLAGRLGPRDVAAARVACALAAAALLPRLGALLPARMLPIVVPLLLAGAAHAPLLWLRRRGERRAQSLRRALPDALDLIGACLGAGLPLRRAVAMVGGHCAEPLATELGCVTAETALGVSQSAALDGLAARNPQPEVRALVAAIRQAERHGSPLAPVIAAQADDARLALNRELVERGARAGPKIQLIISATIVPAALLAMAAVVVAAIARGELTMF